MQLTKYLIRHKQVYIPEIGLFHLEQKGASLDTPEQVIQPPSYAVNHSPNGSLKQQQVFFLQKELNYQDLPTEEQLALFSKAIKQQTSDQSLKWSKLGQLEQTDNNFRFQANPLMINGLQAIPAKRVIREHVQHTVLIGEKEVQAGGQPVETIEEAIEPAKKRSLIWIIALILLLLAIGFIAYYFYSNGLTSSTTGSKFKITPSGTN